MLLTRKRPAGGETQRQKRDPEKSSVVAAYTVRQETSARINQKSFGASAGKQWRRRQGAGASPRPEQGKVPFLERGS